jgi:hypothetical protein
MLMLHPELKCKYDNNITCKWVKSCKKKCKYFKKQQYKKVKT